MLYTFPSIVICKRFLYFGTKLYSSNTTIMIICFSHVLSTKSERLDLSHRLKSSVVDTTHAAVMPPSLDATPYSSSSSSGRSMISYGNVRRAKVRPKPREIKHRRSTVEQEILVRTSQDVSAKQHHEPYGKSKR